MNSSKILGNSRLYCHTKYPEKDLFFSLIDYHNNYFTSDDPDKIIEFYNGFENPDQLINWMRERPKGFSNIHEIDGEKNIVVVIPTADFNGNFAIDCRESIFKGLHIIFVESGERGDFYFNYAHNVNVGIKKAMRYNPKWVVVSNDDVFKIDDIAILQRELSKRDENKITSVYTNKSKYHDIIFDISSYTVLYKIFLPILKHKTRYFYKTQSKFNLKFGLVSKMATKESSMPEKMKQFAFHKLLTRTRLKDIIVPGDFLIISSFGLKILMEQYKQDYLLDENFINGHEDVDLAIKLKVGRFRTDRINYNIGDFVGSTLGNGYQRQLRTISDDVYIFEKYQSLLGDD